MKDIFNNNNNKISGNGSINFSGHANKNIPENKTETFCELENTTEQTSQDYSAIIGRSQVRFGTGNTNLKNDIKEFVQNPKNVANANMFFDLACKKYKNSEHPYEYASILTEEFFKLQND